MKRTGRILILAAVSLAIAWIGPARAQYFGKNKVQYKDFRWSVLQTENFEVYYYQSERAAAVDAARMAERSYTRLSHVLNHEIRERVPLVLYASHADFQSTNISPGFIGEGTGGVTEFLKRRVFLPFTGSYAELEHVLTHELVHAFQVDIFWGGQDRSLLANPFSFQPPLWVMEGSAEYLSLGGLDPLTEMWLRDGALQGYLTPIPALSTTYDIRVYRYGQAVWEYVGRRFGPEAVGKILKRIGASRNVEGSFRRVTGMTLAKLSDAWLEEVRKTYLPQIADHDKPSKFAARLTNHEKEHAGFNLSPAVSPEGDKVVFVSNRKLNNGLYLASTLDGTLLGQLAEGGSSGNLESLRFFYSSSDWSPDGRTIAFPAKAGGKDDINILDVGRAKRVARLRFDLDGIRSPSFSPDGRRLVFAGFDGGHSDLFLCDVDGSHLERLTHDRFAAGSPRFSPDGKRIVFVTDRGPETDYEALRFGPQRMAIFDLETREVTVLPNQVGDNITPHFSPDGTQLLYVGDRTGITNIYRYDLATGTAVQLTNILTGVTGITGGSPPLSVSRNGKRAVFSAFSRGGWDLYCVKDPFEMAPYDTSKVTVARGNGDVARRAAGLGRLTKDLVEEKLDAESAAEAVPEVPSDSLITILARPHLDDHGMLRPTSPEKGHPSPGGTGTGNASPEPSIPVVPPPTRTPDGTKDDGSPYINLRPPSGGVAGPKGEISADSLLAALDALPDSGSFRDRPYKSHFSADFGTAAAGVGGGIGLAGQALVGFSDILGDKQIVVGASIFGSLSDADLFFQYVDRGSRNNKGISLFQFRNDFLLSTASSANEFQSNIYRGGEVTVSRPFDLYRRVEFGLQAVAVTERLFRDDNFFAGPDPEQFDLGTSFYVTPSVALVKDTALYGSTGPIKGTRARVEVRQAVGQQSFTNLTGDYRRYLNVNQRYSFAGRILGATSVGKDEQIFRVGGPFTNRAVDYGEMEGSNILVSNWEFRFPFIDRLDMAWPLPMRLGGIRGVLFFDAGAAWGETYLIDGLDPAAQNALRTFQPFSTRGGFHFQDVLGAYGFGVRMNLGFLLVRWDLARATNIQRNTGKWKGYFALGGEF